MKFSHIDLGEVPGVIWEDFRAGLVAILTMVKDKGMIY
jgi:hypothetical protein